MVFNITRTSPVLFGVGSSMQTGVKLRALGCKKIICVTDKGVKESGVTDNIVKNMEEAGIKVIQYDGVVPDPPDYMMEECAAIAKNEQVDGVVGIGGGSSLDTAKGVNVLLGNPFPIARYHDHHLSLKPGKVLILIPTTAGTGSEVTAVSVVTDTKNNKKGAVIGPPCTATLAIVDPELTVGMPASVTASTGMDAFSHAAEALTSNSANAMSDILSEKAIALIFQNLKAAVRNGSDISARTNMSMAAMIAGIAFNDAIPHLGHAIGHALGAKLHIAHGIACALALPDAIEYVAEILPDKVKFIGTTMGLNLDGMPSQEFGKEVAKAIRYFARDVGIPTMKELKIKKESLDAVAQDTLKDDCAHFIPREITSEKVLEMLYNAYEL